MHQAYLFCACTRGALARVHFFFVFPTQRHPEWRLSGGTSGPWWSALSVPRAFTTAAQKMSHTHTTPPPSYTMHIQMRFFFSVFFLSFFLRKEVSDTDFCAVHKDMFFEAYWIHALSGCARSLVCGRRHRLSAASMRCHQLRNFPTNAKFFQRKNREDTSPLHRVETD